MKLPALKFRKPRSWLQWARRASQVVFLLLFLGLILAAYVLPGETASPLLHIFFDFDPLVALGTLFAAHGVTWWAGLSLVTVALTLVLGRAFCGWVCPMGAVHHGASWLAGKWRKGAREPIETEYSPRQRYKYYLLGALLLMALLGANWIGIFDPLSLLYRSTATAVAPAAQYAVEESTTAAYQSDPGVGPLRLTLLTEPVYEFSRDYIFRGDRQSFTGATLILALFLAIVLLNLARTRFWCRYVCPLGAMLGLLAKRPFLRLKQDRGMCDKCGKCSLACPAGADPDKPKKWRATECYTCWNCVSACENDALAFVWASPKEAPSKAKLDLSRRGAVAAGLGGLGALLLFRAHPEAQARTFNPALIRPPGARPEREFLARCVQCGACMRICPTNALHPAGFEAGLEGLWSPVLRAKLGYCEYECNACTHACPTEAIQPLTMEEKKEVKIGLAAFDTGRCLPYASARDCMVCQEHCPVPEKAIYFVETQVPSRDGGSVAVKQPKVDPDLCIGCGICENVCVFRDKPGIYVTSANETRNPENHAILAGFDFAPSGGADANSDPYGSAGDPGAN